jgi:ATP-dependent DNA ligase
MVKTILDNAGEGVILRKMGSRYEHGRSTSLLKFKVSNIKF